MKVSSVMISLPLLRQLLRMPDDFEIRSACVLVDVDSMELRVLSNINPGKDGQIVGREVKAEDGSFVMKWGPK